MPGIHFDKVKFDELADDFLADYRINKKKSLRRAQASLAHLDKFFSGIRATEINTAKVKKYVELRF
jgi:hypothetical protein